MSTVGLTSNDWKLFSELLIKANVMQLQSMTDLVVEERVKRIKRTNRNG